MKRFQKIFLLFFFLWMAGCANSNLASRPLWARGAELLPKNPLYKRYGPPRYITQVIKGKGKTFQEASENCKKEAQSTFAKMILSKVTSIYQRQIHLEQSQYRESFKKKIDSYLKVSTDKILISGLKEILTWGEGYEGDQKYYFACFALDKVKSGNIVGQMALNKYGDLQEINRRISSPSTSQMERERLALEFLKTFLNFNSLYYQAQFFEKNIPQVKNTSQLKQECLKIISQAIELRIRGSQKDLEEALKFAEVSLGYQPSRVIEAKITIIKQKLPCTECGFQKFCLTCQGKKGQWVTCPRCNGTRQIRPNCTRCRGTGKETCSRCNGKGKTATRCVTCQGKGRITCAICSGQGVLEGKCRICSGQGRLLCRTCRGKGTKTVVSRVGKTCPTCRGKKYLLCSTCRGQGFITYRNRRGRIMRRPCPARCNRGFARKKVICSTCRGRKVIFGRPCRTCGGRGWGVINLIPCSTCGGRGGTYQNVTKVVPCPACRGRKTFTCRTCQGKGRLRVRCDSRAPSLIFGLFPQGASFCGGMKTTLCPQCRGTAETWVRCPQCQGNGRYGLCGHCNGTGWVIRPCPQCPLDHKGEVWKTCKHCRGSGLCPTCGGRGHRM